MGWIVETSMRCSGSVGFGHVVGLACSRVVADTVVAVADTAVAVADTAVAVADTVEQVADTALVTLGLDPWWCW